MESSQKLSGDYSNKMGTKIKALKSVMLVGNPEFGALIENPDLYVGLMYMEENMHYPPHAHEAFETYTMVSGNGCEIRHEEYKKDGTAMVTAFPTPYIHTKAAKPMKSKRRTNHWYACTRGQALVWVAVQK